MINLALLLLLVPATVVSLNCTVCDFKLQPPHNSSCNETCEGDICFIVVNKYFNGTINAGCMHLREGDSFENQAVCQRGQYDNRCACSTSDHCNNPKVKISSYTFTETPVLESYQWLPQIQPPMPSLQPILPPEDIPIEGETHGNETTVETDTSTELENGVESDLAHILDDRNATNVMRNEENDENLLTVTTSVGLNVRDHSNRAINDPQQQPTTERSFTPGHGSVEVTKVSQDVSPRMQPTRSNLTTTDGEGPNGSGHVQVLLAALVPILLQKLL